MASAKALDALGLAVLKAGISGVVYATGFRAVSDDDFSRVVIAMRFAHAPGLDPSGTSWLPLPFWLMGGPMTLFGSTLEVARTVAFAQGVLATLLIWQAARWLGLSRLQAWLGAAVASAFPYAAWLGVATVPEFLASALVVLGVASTAGASLGQRSLGALALAAASLCRYEAWFVLAGFVVVQLAEALRARTPRFLLPPLMASAAPAAWLLHGKVTHGSATFFLHRVAAYREAVGGGLANTWDELLSYPVLLFTREPELALLTLVATTALFKLAPSQLRAFQRPALLLAVMLSALMAGAVVGGAPTHHPERALVAIWILASLVLVRSALEVQRELEPRRHGLARIALAGAILVGLAMRYTGSQRQEFVTRKEEVALGREARELVGDGRLLIGSRDYGFFAVIAGFGAPDRAIPTDLRDPRQPKASDPFESVSSLQERLARERADALVAPREHARLAERVGQVRSRHGDYLLLTTRRP